MKVNLGPYPEGREKRKVEVKLDHYDTWNVDSTLAHIILPLMKKFRKVYTGIPGHMLPSFNPTKAQEKAAHKKYAYILDEIIWAFERIVKDDHNKYYFVKTKEARAKERAKFNKRKKAGKLTEFEEITGFLYIGKLHKGKYNTHYRRFNRAMKWFGEYYTSFWT